MSTMSKSPLAVAREAMATALEELPAYSSKHSPRRFTQQQLFAMLVLRQFFRTDYRGIVGILRDSDELQRALAITEVPHYSTLCYAAQRFEKGGLELAV
jgi:Transposase domain (DUF772)